jgi:hypothetical protein
MVFLVGFSFNLIVGFLVLPMHKNVGFFFTPAPPSIPQSHTKKPSLKMGIYFYICRVSIQNEEIGEVRRLKRKTHNCGILQITRAFPCKKKN